MSQTLSLSGFLITASALRLSLKDFLINRALRILPALIVDIFFAMLIVGPLFTYLPLQKYFSSGQTYHYLTNIVGLMNYRLPGVFSNNPLREVNAALWTVPFEIGCYAILAVLIVFGALRRGRVLILLAAIILGIGLIMCAMGFKVPPVGHLQAALDHLFFDRGSRLLVAFVGGIIAFHYRYRIPYSKAVFAASCLFVLVVAAIGSKGYPTYPVPVISALIAAPLVYITMFLGLTRIPPLPFYSRGDYSYGIYLYHFPVLQILRSLFPRFVDHSSLMLIAGIPAVTLFAAFSWHCIEKPILRLRKKHSFVARQRLAESPPDPALAGAEYDRPLAPGAGTN